MPLLNSQGKVWGLFCMGKKKNYPSLYILFAKVVLEKLKNKSIQTETIYSICYLL
jgi:hypothetical protein